MDTYNSKAILKEFVPTRQELIIEANACIEDAEIRRLITRYYDNRINSEFIDGVDNYGQEDGLDYDQDNDYACDMQIENVERLPSNHGSAIHNDILSTPGSKQGSSRKNGSSLKEKKRQRGSSSKKTPRRTSVSRSPQTPKSQSISRRQKKPREINSYHGIRVVNRKFPRPGAVWDHVKYVQLLQSVVDIGIDKLCNLHALCEELESQFAYNYKTTYQKLSITVDNIFCSDPECNSCINSQEGMKAFLIEELESNTIGLSNNNSPMAVEGSLSFSRSASKLGTYKQWPRIHGINMEALSKLNPRTGTLSDSIKLIRAVTNIDSLSKLSKTSINQYVDILAQRKDDYDAVLSGVETIEHLKLIILGKLRYFQHRQIFCSVELLNDECVLCVKDKEDILKSLDELLIVSAKAEENKELQKIKKQQNKQRSKQQNKQQTT
jgi:hypothetical protein